MKVIKPKLAMQAMCIYKFTLSNGFYYYGATTDLGDRISCHLKRYRTNTLQNTFKNAFEHATSIKFEIVKYLNDRTKLKDAEEIFLSRHVGLPYCLNTDLECKTAFQRGKAVFKVARLNTEGSVIKIYETPSIAARDLGISRSRVDLATLTKYPKTEYILRKLDNKGEITVPINPYSKSDYSKPINQYDKEMNFITSFVSISDAARKLNFDRKGIGDVLNGRYKHTHGFIFQLK